jgi:hypothetical protein
VPGSLLWAGTAAPADAVAERRASIGSAAVDHRARHLLPAPSAEVRRLAQAGGFQFRQSMLRLGRRSFAGPGNARRVAFLAGRGLHVQLYMCLSAPVERGQLGHDQHAHLRIGLALQALTQPTDATTTRRLHHRPPATVRALDHGSHDAEHRICWRGGLRTPDHHREPHAHPGSCIRAGPHRTRPETPCRGSCRPSRPEGQRQARGPRRRPKPGRPCSRRSGAATSRSIAA